MNRRSLTLIIVGLISIIVVSSVIVYEWGFTGPNTSSGALWQRPIKNFANNLAVADGRVFTTNDLGNVNCFDSQNGRSIWNASLESQYSTIVVSGNQVYVGFQERNVGLLDENTGKLLWTFQNELAPNQIFKSAPSIIVKDGRLFAISGVISGHNATTGALLWQATPTAVNNLGTIMELNNTWPGGWVNGFPLDGDPFDDNYVYATGIGPGGNFSNVSFFKINTNNGIILWRSSVAWDGTFLTFGVRILPSVVAMNQQCVIIRNFNQLFTLDSNTGKELWSIDIGATIYNPVVNNNLLLFGAADGNFYALNIADGTVAWKTKVDTQNIFSFANSTNLTPAQTSSIQIDSQNQQVFWSFAVKQGDSPSNYTATLVSLDLANGNVTWTKQVEGTWVNGPSTGLAFNKGRLFLTGNNALWVFNASTGELVQRQQFDHYVLTPIVLGNETFVAADLWLFAYT